MKAMMKSVAVVLTLVSLVSAASAADTQPKPVARRSYSVDATPVRTTQSYGRRTTNYYSNQDAWSFMIRDAGNKMSGNYGIPRR